MMKKIDVLLTGAHGQLGRELQRCTPDNVNLLSFGRNELDITDKRSVESAINHHKPDVVINAAAYTNVDKAEKEVEKAFLVNAEGPRHLALACQCISCRIIHISTDFVFDGNKSSPYLAEDIAKPLNVYGESKLKGEQYLLKYEPNNTAIIRTSWLYSVFAQNFVKTMLRLITEKERIGVIDDQVGTPTNASGLAKAIWKFVDIGVPEGIYHWSDAGVASWYDFAVAIMEEAASVGVRLHSTNITPIQTNDYPTLAKRPKYSVLDKTIIWKLLEVEPQHWRVALREALSEMNKSNEI